MVSRFMQPSRLENVAVVKLGDWVAQQAERQMDKILEGILQKDSGKSQKLLGKAVSNMKLYIEFNVPWMIHNELLKEVIRALDDLITRTKQSYGFRIQMGKFVSQMNIIVSMLETVFTRNVTVVSMDSVPKLMRSLFYSKLHMLTGLEYLNLGSLSGGWKTSDMEKPIVDILRGLHQLKYLYINYDCTNTILQCISDNCKNIVKLDLSSSKCVDNDSIDIITEMKTLKNIQLYRTMVTLDGFVKLLIYLKGLEDIGRCDEIGKVLETISYVYPKAHQFNLVIYESRYAPQNHLELAVEMCPLIQAITIFHNSLAGDLMVLVGLRDLFDLKLLSCDFYADQIKNVLEVKGNNIINLHLEHVDQIDLNALMYISQMCPLLEKLTLYNCTLIQHTSLYTNKLQILPFRNLKRFTCVANCKTEQLLFVLTNCMNIEFIHLGSAVELNDDILAKVFEKNPLLYLKELRVLQSDCLSMSSIHKIIDNCSSLEVLVELESWSLLTDIDRDYIRNYIKINNLKVNTAPVRRYAC